MRISIIVLLFLFVFSACQKEYTGAMADGSDSTINIPGGPTTGGTGSFTASINGKVFVADKGATAGFSVAANGLPALINISGLASNGGFITITLTDSGVHRYTLADQTTAAGAYDDNITDNITYTTNQGPAGITTGWVDITKIDTAAKTISGTFNFKVYSVINGADFTITNGSFINVPYLPAGQVLPPASTTDTFNVKIDGTPFKTYSVTGTKLSAMGTLFIQCSDSLVVRTVGITCPADVTPGIYQYDFINYMAIYNNGVGSIGANTGSLQILEHNTSTKRIRGTFNFEGSNLLDPTMKATLTEGYFSVTYQ